VSLKVVPAGAPTCTKLALPGFSRSTKYPVTPTLSVDAGQLRLIWLPLTAVAVRLAGVVGDCVSGVVALATGEYALRFPAPSVARTR